MKISRQIGTVSERLNIFVPDATVTTGAGLANLQVSSFSTYWFREGMTSTSTVVMTSATALGTWSSGAWTQINSTFMKGWYQFGAPDGVFASSKSVALHMYGHPSMAPVPIELELTRTDNQTYVSSQSFNMDYVRLGLIPTSATGIQTINVSTLFGQVWVTTAAGVLGVGAVGVSSFGLQVGVSTFNSPVGVSSFDIRVGVSSFNSPVGVSSFGLPVGISSINARVDVSSIYGSAFVTTAAGIVATVFDLARTANVNSTVAFSSVSFSSQAVTVGSVDVTSFSGNAVVVTGGKLTVDVSTLFGSRFVTSVAGVLASHVTSLRAAVDAQIADRMYGRNIAGVSDGGRTLTEALYLLRNRTEIAGGVMTVYGVDDATSSWSANISTTAGNPISQIDPN